MQTARKIFFLRMATSAPTADTAAAIQQLTRLLQSSQAALGCGPDCQKQTETDKLRAQLDAARLNVETAPARLQGAEKRFVTYARGERAYDRLRERQLTERARELGSAIREVFDGQFAATKQAVDLAAVAEAEGAEIDAQSGMAAAQRRRLRAAHRRDRTHVSTNDRKVWYEAAELDRLRLWHTLWWRTYWLLYVLYALALLLTARGHAMSVFRRIGAIAGFAALPFVLCPVARRVWLSTLYVWNRLPHTVYANL
jgi:hypothetical protein